MHHAGPTQSKQKGPVSWYPFTVSIIRLVGPCPCRNNFQTAQVNRKMGARKIIYPINGPVRRNKAVSQSERGDEYSRRGVPGTLGDWWTGWDGECPWTLERGRESE
jgi:hypothetical protein